MRLGTRGSPLALWQTEHVRTQLVQKRPDLVFETVVITTKGDFHQDKSLPLIGGKGLFTAELESSLRNGLIDLAVHSLKDLPTQDAPGLVIGAVLHRADPADVLVSRFGYDLATLPQGARVGTGSPRRAAQMLHVRPDLRILDLRGNADTRLRKAFDRLGSYDAIIIARAALERLGRLDAITMELPQEVMLPAPGQGAVAVQCRDEPEILELLKAVDHLPTRLETAGERAFLKGLGGGCAVPIAARGTFLPGGRLRLAGRVCAPDGTAKVDVVLEEALPSETDWCQAAYALGHRVAAEAVKKGAAELLGEAAP